MGMSFRLVVVCLALWVSAVYGRDGAFLVVTRSVIDPEKPVREIPRGHQMWESYPGVVQGKEFAVAYEIRNLGNGPATEVTVTEESFPADSFRIVTGKTATVFDEIAGGMNESYVVRLRAKVTGTLPLPPAIVEYMDGYKQRTCSSTTERKIEIESAAAYLKRTNLHLTDWAMVAAASFVITAAPFSVFLSGRAKLLAASGKKKQQ
uniref:Translocon-associated protein subunit beta n=1 Tax=Compsopogon caeruleus TaxID=31354 RepID=A0A7S1TFC3_9RHOD|mmetsp:Transcript_4498/g.8970  ORF Transcript_4498/g.8970 Transcript_4498/m.8970 type:complete len:206 (+) Transcript_4498:1502-2119(+)